MALATRRPPELEGGQRARSNSAHNRIGDSYYLAIDGQIAAKPYTLLRKALERSDKVAVAKFAWHNRERPRPAAGT